MKEINKMVIYQVFTRLFGNDLKNNEVGGNLTQNGCSKMNDFTDKALQQIHALGATHIWYTGVIAHATQTDYSAYGIPRNHPAVVKGIAGSPYAIRDYYDIDPDLSVDVEHRMTEFESLIERSHRNGLQVIIDFVPNHVAREYHSLVAPEGVRDLGQDDDTNQAFDADNNFYYIPGVSLGGDINLWNNEMGAYIENPARATGNNRFDAYPNANDWYETVKLNYGVDYLNNTGCHFSPSPDTWRKMRDILLFWAAKGIDGFRCDMAEMVPCEFWGWAIPQIKEKFPEVIFIAEVYNPAEYRNYIFNGKFDYLYDKVGLYDTLRGVVCGYASAMDITRCWQSVNDIQKNMLNFLENHDEQRIASDFFAGDARKALPALVVSACMNTNPMMIYFGQELGEKGMDQEGFSGKDGRTTIFDYWSVDTLRRWKGNGTFNGTGLSEEELELQAYYRKVLTLCNAEKALLKGQFFDLMYVNSNCSGMNPHKQYAFLRRCEDEVLLVVANFDAQSASVSVNLPQHAFEYFQLSPTTSCEAEELLTGQKMLLPFFWKCPVQVEVPSYGAVILKFRLAPKE